MSNTASSSQGIGFFGLLTIAFVVLKLTGYINWSWWVVFLPIFINLAIAILVLTGIAIVLWKLNK